MGKINASNKIMFENQKKKRKYANTRSPFTGDLMQSSAK